MAIQKSHKGITQHIIALILLLAVLVQVGMFFVGLEVPLQRLTRLWGKPFQERQALIWPVGRTFSQLAEQLPRRTQKFTLKTRKARMSGFIATLFITYTRVTQRSR